MQNPQRKLFDSGDWALAQQGAQPTDDAHILYGSPPSEGHGPMLHKPADSASQAPSNLGGRDSPSVTTPRQVATAQGATAQRMCWCRPRLQLLHAASHAAPEC